MTKLVPVKASRIMLLVGVTIWSILMFIALILIGMDIKVTEFFSYEVIMEFCKVITFCFALDIGAALYIDYYIKKHKDD